MADTKITALTALTAADPANDVLPIVDVSDTTMAASGTTKKISVNNILGASGTATLASATITGDLTVDTSTLKVDSANNRVGIVNASPTRALDVVGSAIVSSEIRCSSLDTGTTTGDLYLFTSNRLSQTAAPTIECQNASKPLIINHTGSQSMLFGIGSSLQMTLNSTGLGIGGSPSSRLDVANSGTPVVFSMTLTGAQRWQQIIDTSVGNWTLRDQTGSKDVLIATAGSGNVGIGVTPSAGKGCLQISSGINFPATQVASSDANTLDDYEEGSFTPTPNSGTFSAASAKYTKIGNMVTVFFDLTIGTGGGSQITNLPFTAASTSTVASGIYTNNQTYAAGTTAPVVVVGGSGTVMYFRTVGTGVAFSAMSFTAGANLTGTISYFV